MTVLSNDEVDRALEERAPQWTRDADEIRRSVEAASFLDGIALVQRVAEAAERAQHHPDIDIRWTTVTFALSTHSEGGITAADIDMAEEIDKLA
jgi:4a-hydroxytetrahydrobiopterin dehydratase